MSLFLSARPESTVYVCVKWIVLPQVVTVSDYGYGRGEDLIAVQMRSPNPISWTRAKDVVHQDTFLGL